MACQALTGPVACGNLSAACSSSINTSSSASAARQIRYRVPCRFVPLQRQALSASRHPGIGAFKKGRRYRVARTVCSAAQGSSEDGGEGMVTKFTEDLKQRAADFAETAKSKAAELAEETQAKAADLAEEAKR